MDTPQTMIMAGTAIKILIDVFGWVIPSYMKRPIAIVLWLAWALAFVTGSIDSVLFFGITTWASAIGINELASKISPSTTVPNELWHITPDDQV